MGHDPPAAARLLTRAAADTPDPDLLARFAAAADGAAFAELVRRHGPMVLGVCRRVLGPGPDADDAFQAAFLVLARKAGAVRDRGAVGSYLFGVARHVAQRVRDRDRRRRHHERRAAGRVLSPADPADPELLAVLDAELRALPERYRSPLVACHLEGRTLEQAARDLGWSVSTVRRRLDRGRELLRHRLTRRGAAPALAAAGTVTTPAALAADTARLAAGFAHHEPLAAPAAALAEGVLTMMTRTKLVVTVGAVVALIGAAVGTAALWPAADAAPPRPAAAVQPEPPKPKPADPPPAKKDAPPADDRIKPGDRLRIKALHTFDMDPLSGLYRVEPAGTLPLSPVYGGRVKVDGLTVVEAEKVVLDQVKKFVRDPQVTVIRYDPETDADEAVLTRRVRILEQEVRELKAAVEELKKKR